MQQRGQGGDDHEHEQAAAPSHQPHGRAQRQAGRHGDASLGVVVGVEVVEDGRVVGLVVHHAAGETVVDPVTRQPGHQRGDPTQGRQLFPALFQLRRSIFFNWAKNDFDSNVLKVEWGEKHMERYEYTTNVQ